MLFKIRSLSQFFIQLTLSSLKTLPIYGILQMFSKAQITYFWQQTFSFLKGMKENTIEHSLAHDMIECI